MVDAEDARDPDAGADEGSTLVEGGNVRSTRVEGPRAPSTRVDGSHAPSTRAEGVSGPPTLIEGGSVPSSLVEGPSAPSTLVEAPSAPSSGVDPYVPPLMPPLLPSLPLPLSSSLERAGIGSARWEPSRRHSGGPTLGTDRPPPPPSLRDPDAPSLREGTLISGVYRVLRRVGEGAMGVIVLANDEHLRRRVAIKLLRPDQVDDHSMQGRLLDEARALARVRHPNVVEIYAFGEHGMDRTGAPSPYFVMEYVEGTSLDVHTQRRGGPPLELDEALSLIDPICLGVAAIHAAGVVHRDLKPSNILVGPAMRVVVADLGLARKFGDEESSQPSFSGTPAYLAPEVALRRRVDPALLPRVDVYALGLIAYWLLVGRLPFDGRSAFDLFKQHAHRSPPAPSELRPELPPSFDAPLLAALAKDPAERTESAEALREGLLTARGDAPVKGLPLRVVVADDNDHFRTFLSEVLRVALPGARIEAVADGLTALAAIRRDPPAIGVFDLDMPGLDGIQLTAAVRALPTGGDFPIIVATGTGGASDWLRLSQLGASAFLVKPFDAGQLITLARGLVGMAVSDAPVRSVRP